MTKQDCVPQPVFEGNKNIDMMLVSQLMGELHRLLERNSLTARKYFTQLQQALSGNKETEELIVVMAVQMNELDFRAAEKTLSSLEQLLIHK
jgi:hypothetical protein